MKIQIIDKKVGIIKYESKNIIEEYTQQIDSIKIDVTEFKNKIYITSKFQNSKTIFTGSFYFDEKELIFSSFIELSTKSLDDPEKNVSEYYFNKDNLIHYNNFTELSSFAVCLPIPENVDSFDYYGFNRNLTNKFYLKYIDFLKEIGIIKK